jgi:hypothetical protein
MLNDNGILGELTFEMHQLRPSSHLFVAVTRRLGPLSFSAVSLLSSAAAERYTSGRSYEILYAILSFISVSENAQISQQSQAWTYG